MPDQASWGPAVFARIYAKSDDPWQFETSEYEKQKRAATLEALRKVRMRFGSAFEVGCATGMLTVELARLCDRLLAVDVASRALNAAARRCIGLQHVEVRRMQVPQAWPTSRLDLIVLSEVLYFSGCEDVALAACRTMDTLDTGGCVLLVNWTGATDTPCSGDKAATLFIAETAGRLMPAMQQRQPSYRIDVLVDATQSRQETPRPVRFAT